MTDDTTTALSPVVACGDRLETLIGHPPVILCHLAFGHVGMHSNGQTQWSVIPADTEIDLLRRERTSYRNALWKLASEVNRIADDMECWGKPVYLRDSDPVFADIHSYREQLRAAVAAARPDVLPE